MSGRGGKQVEIEVRKGEREGMEGRRVGGRAGGRKGGPRRERV
jgi:hypothetical protein